MASGMWANIQAFVASVVGNSSPDDCVKQFGIRVLKTVKTE